MRCGRFQCEGGVTHLISEHLIDLTDLLRSVGDRDDPLSMRHGSGDEAKIGPVTTCARAQGRSSCRQRLNCRSNQPRCQPSGLRHGISIDVVGEVLILGKDAAIVMTMSSLFVMSSALFWVP